MLRPIDADVHLKYVCNQCGSTMWASITEARTPNYILICGDCHSVHKLKLVDKVSVSFVRSEKSPEVFARVQPAKIKTTKEENEWQDVVSMLVNLGHDKKKAKLLVSQGSSSCSNKDELIKWCLQHSV